MATPITIELTTNKSQLNTFLPILWQGFTLQVTLGSSLHDLLTDQLQLDPDFIKSKIRTIFLDGSPVDDPKTALIHQNARIALGGAAPGLAGIALRRHSPAAFARDDITSQTKATQIASKKGPITIRLFNEIAPILAPNFLTPGLTTTTKSLIEILKTPPNPLKIRLNQTPIALPDLLNHLSQLLPTSPVFLKIIF
ncbi:MAG: hypothetical protein GY869_10370 [Planctomycetes bacterium]|nr:hypothetical protein [Planctomycetota bacterium]